MSLNTKNVFDVMQRITDSAETIIFISIKFVIRYQAIKLSILCSFQSLTAAALDVINLQYRDFDTPAVTRKRVISRLVLQ